MTSISEKRANETDDVYYKANVVLVDIEGTTTSIDFVKNTLFPYVRKNLEVYLKSKWNDDEFKDDLKLLQDQSKQDEADGVEGLVKIPEGFSEDICEEVKKNVLWQMDLDRKTKALKQLQGHMWREAYNKGEVKAHVYPDVAPALKSWKQSGKDIYVYSSGSVEAQKLLFGHTQDGNLLELFSGYFDTTVGPKVEESSYSNIVNSVKCKSEEIIFFTDVPKEARAAKSVGLQAVIVVREGNLPITDDDKLEFPVIRSFDDIVFETSVKRRKKSEEQPLEQGKPNSVVVEVSSVQDVEMEEEPTVVKTDTSKTMEGVSNTEMVEAADKQPALGETCATSEETKQTSCKEKDTLNNELASTKQTGAEVVSDKGTAEVTEKNETHSKTLEVNGADKLNAGSDNQTESNGPKCPEDILPDSDTNNIDNLPVTGKVDVVSDGKTDSKLTDNKTKLNDKTEICKDDSKIGDDLSRPVGEASTNSDATNSEANVESLTDKTESTSSDTAELPNKTECTNSEKTENVSAKIDCTSTNNSESTPDCKTESLKPIDTESAVTKKTEPEVNKTEPMETDDVTSGNLRNKGEAVQKDKTNVTHRETDTSPLTDEVKGKVAVASGENEALASPADSKMETAGDGKPETVGEATTDNSKAAVGATSDGSKIESAVEANPDDGKVEAVAKATPDGDETAAEASSNVSKVDAAIEATPGSGKTAADTTSNGSKGEVADEATPDGGKVEAAVEATPDGGKVQAAAKATPDDGKVEAVAKATPDDGKVEAVAKATPNDGKVEAVAKKTPDGGKVEATAEATPDSGKVEAAAEATPDSGKVEAAAEVTPDSGKVEAAAEATPDSGKVEAEAIPDSGKVEAAAEATPDSGKVEAAVEATPDSGKVEAAAEATPDSGKVEAAAEATPDSGKVEAASEVTPDSGKVEAASEVTPDSGKVEAAAEAAPDDGKVEAAAEETPDGGKVEAAAEASPDGGKVEAAAEATPDGGEVDTVNVAKVTSDVKTDSAAPVAEVKVDNETDVPMEDAEPMVTDDSEKMSTDEAEPMVKDECEPMVTDDGEPMATDEAKPIAEAAKHPLTNDTESMVTEDHEPMVTDNVEPTVTSKDETVNNTENDSEKPKTAPSEKNTEPKEESNECTKNASSDSAHVNDNTNCNSVDKDVAVKDTNESAGTGKDDAAAAEKDGEAVNTKTESSNTENKISKPEEQNAVDNAKEVKNEIGKNGMNSCVENGECTEKTDNTTEKLKIAAESTDKVVENVVST